MTARQPALRSPHPDAALEPVPLRVRTLGGFAVRRGMHEIPAGAWARRKVLALFTCLLSVPGYRRHREELIDILWPDAVPAAGANNMRVTLHRLRAILDEPGVRGGYVCAEGDVIALSPFAGGQPPVGSETGWLDASAFAHAASAALAGRDPAACRAARVLYTGDYLPDSRYDEWVEGRREELRQQYLALLLHGARLSAEDPDERETAGWLEAILAHDRIHEQAARRLMRLHARRGRRGEALRVYERLEAALAADLGQGSERKTRELATSIRRMQPVVPGAPTSASALRPAEPADAASLPVGTVTFLMTDIEGSTPLWEAHPEAMRAAMARHDALVDAALARHGGQRIKARGEGDSIFAVFATPSAALAGACAIGELLHAEEWPAGATLRTRIGIHTGEADLQEGDYHGSTVNRAARIRSLAHGGQILISGSTYMMVRDALLPQVALQPLGCYTLKGLHRSEEIYQVVHPALPSSFPPLSGGDVPTNLPAPVSSFVGRERERQEVGALLTGHRLLTLTGPGGAGKTRLALAVAGDVAAEYPDGVRLVELAVLPESTAPYVASVSLAVAAALGLCEEADHPILDTLIQYLAFRRLLLVLDNCEHLIGACATLAGVLLRACPELRILASSRERMDVAGEISYQVPPLSTPDPDRLPPLEALAGYPAVALFVERARERRPSFDLSARNAAEVARICARLDGLPLAIELAAARVGSLSVEDIAARLDDCFRLLTGGPRTAAPRQQTLHAALDWGYALLSEPERILFRRLSAFASGWMLASAEAVCAGDGLESWLIVDLLDRLVNRSLVVMEEPSAGGETRYRLLETVRQYAWEKLSTAGEARAVRERHLAWCSRLAEEAVPALMGPEQGAWLERLGREHDNFRAALTWSRRDAALTTAGAELAVLLAGYWTMRSHVSEGRRWLEAAGASTEAPPVIRARALAEAALLARLQGDLRHAVALCERCLALRRDLGDQRGIAQALYALGTLAQQQGDCDRAIALIEESLAQAQALGDPRGQVIVRSSLAVALRAKGDFDRARALLEESLVGARALGDSHIVATVCNNLGTVARDMGERERARAWYEEALAINRALGATLHSADLLANLAELAADAGELARAEALYRESLGLYRDLDGKPGIAVCLQGLARVALEHGKPERCATLIGAAAALRAAMGTPAQPDEAAMLVQISAGAREAMGADRYATAQATGQAMPLAQAIALAETAHDTPIAHE